MQLLLDDGSLATTNVDSCWEHLVAHAQPSSNSRTFSTSREDRGGHASLRTATLWHCAPPPSLWLERGEAPSEEGCRSHIESYFEELSNHSLVSPLERMLQCAEKSDAQLDTSAAQLPAANIRRLQRPQLLSAVFSSPETVATIALVDASLVCSGRGSGVSLLPAHVLHTFLDSHAVNNRVGGALFEGGSDAQSPLASFHAAASPRRSLKTPASPASAIRRGPPGPIPVDRVLGFEVTCLGQRVIGILAPLVSHWVLVGTPADCMNALRTLSRGVAALRAADSPIAALSETLLSIVALGEFDETAHMAHLCAVISSLPPTMVTLPSSTSSSGGAGSTASPVRRKESLSHLLHQHSSHGHHHESLLGTLRTLAWLTKPLCLHANPTNGAVAVPMTLRLVHAIFALAGGRAGVSTSLAVDIIMESAATVTAEFHRFVLANGIAVLSRNAMLASRYSSIEELETLIRRSTRCAFQDLCGPLNPRLSVLDSLDDNLASLSKATLNDLQVESYHIAQHEAAAAVRGMANQLTDADVTKMISPLQWTTSFEESMQRYFSRPLMPSGGSNEAGEDPEENIILRSWAVQAKRSAMVDIVTKWYLPNSKLLFSGFAERSELRQQQVDAALRAAHQKQSDLENRLAIENERLKVTAAQLGRVHAAADNLQETHNKLQRSLVEMQSSASAKLRVLRALQVEANFLEQNRSDDSPPSRGSPSSAEHESAAATQQLHSTVQALLSGIENCLKLLGPPTHGLLIEPGKGITAGAFHRPAAGERHATITNHSSAKNTPNVSAVGASAVNTSLGINRSGVVRSPERRRGDALLGDIQSARLTSANLQEDAAGRHAVSQFPVATVQPPSPISPMPVPLPRGPHADPRDVVDLDRQEERVHASMAAVVELQQRAATLREQLSAAQMQNRHLDGKLRDALMDTAALRDDLHDSNVSYQEAKRELQLALTDLTTERNAHETTSATLGERTEEIRHLRGLLDAETIRTQQLEGQIESIQLQLTDKTVCENRFRTELAESERRVEILTVQSSMHASTSQQTTHQLSQIEKTLLHERTEKREAIHRYEQRVQELLAKLDETVSRYEKVVAATATEAASRIDELTRELSDAQNAARSSEQARSSTGEELESYRREFADLSSQNDQLTKERDDLRRSFQQLEDRYRALDVHYRTAVEENNNKEETLATLRQELHQSKQARAMLVHSMDSLNMFIEEQRALSGDDGRLLYPISQRIADGNVEGDHSLLEHNSRSAAHTYVDVRESASMHRPHHPQVPEAMSVIRSLAAESIAREDTPFDGHRSGNPRPSSSPTHYYAPLRELPHNISTASSTRNPISLSQLMHECPSDSEHHGPAVRRSPTSAAAPSFAPVYVPPAPRNRTAGARPLGPHLQALSAIDSLLGR